MEIKIHLYDLGHMINMATLPIYGKTLQNLFLRNRRADIHETWYVASGTPANYSLFKWPWSDLDLFYGKVKFGNLGFSVAGDLKIIVLMRI